MERKKQLIIVGGAVGIALGVIVVFALALGIGLGVGLNKSSSGTSNGSGPTNVVYSGGLSPKCPGATGTPSNPPLNLTFVSNVAGQTSWFAAPVVYDLNQDGSIELIAAYYKVYIYNSNLKLLASVDPGSGRVYAPHVVHDLDGDGITEICFGQGNYVYAYNYNATSQKLTQKWSATIGNNNYEVRGMAAADLNNTGSFQVVVTTTRTDGTSVFVYNGATGANYQPPGGQSPAWPRYNSLDSTVNGQGNHGYGEYGLNVGIGNINADSNLEIITTFDDHQIQAFRIDGSTLNTSDYFVYPYNPWEGYRVTWGQIIRWYDAWVEEGLYHNLTFDATVQYNPWLQWTASPPNVADLDRDGQAEVIGIPNVELDPSNSGDYITQYYAVVVYNGDWANTGATRKQGWTVFPHGETPIQVSGYYPPSAPPAPVIVDILGGPQLEIITTLNDGGMYCFDYQANLLWVYNFKHGLSIMYSTEPTIADLNNDGSPEIIFATYGDPNVDSGYLEVLAADGSLLLSTKLNDLGQTNGNGNGIPAAPTVADLNGDGHLEIFLQSFEHGMDVYTVPQSTTNCIPWYTARGGNLRKGAPDS